MGGYVANKGQEQRLDAERASRMLDQRIDAYFKFLRAAENEADEAGTTPDPSSKQPPPRSSSLLAPRHCVRRQRGFSIGP